MVRSRFAVTLAVGYPQRNTQIVLLHHNSVAEVIFNFDVDACQVAFDGKRVVATPSAHRALLTGINIADAERSSARYESRLAKYASLGFYVAVPGLNLSKVRPKFLRDHCYVEQKGELKHVTLKQHTADDGTVTGTSCQRDDGALKGLEKLLVYGSLFRWNELGLPYMNIVADREERKRELPFAVGSQGYNYLLKESRVDGQVRENWRLATPPNPPPSGFLRDDDQEEALTGSGGGPLVGYRIGVTAEEIYDHLHLILNDDLDYDDSEVIPKPICCYNFIRDIRNGVNCPQVGDATLQYRRHYDRFRTDDNCESEGDLPRLLRFTKASQTGQNPWVRLDEDGWASGAYAQL